MMSSALDSRFQDKLGRCIHCGLCLPACPTYDVSRTEMEGPRGRLALMSAVATGRVSPGGAFSEHIGLCLGCRACETACPSGVEYGALLATARSLIDANRSRSGRERLLRWLVLRVALPNRGFLRFLAGALRVAERMGLVGLVRRVSIVPAGLRKLAGLLPAPVRLARKGARIAPAFGEARGRVAFFRGCVQDAFLGAVNDATVRVLRHNGYDVYIPAGQTCCGAAAHHLGEDDLARRLACDNLDAFGPDRFEAVINNAGGCGAVLKEYEALFEPGSARALQARAFSGKVRDLSEFLATGREKKPMGRITARATYADSCHLRHAQGVVEAPRRLLRAIPGLELVELNRPEHCCGSAGVYNITHAGSADDVLQAKMADVRGTDADLIVTTNTGCHLQLLDGVRRFGGGGKRPEVVHLAELLDRSYASSE